MNYARGIVSYNADFGNAAALGRCFCSGNPEPPFKRFFIGPGQHLAKQGVNETVDL